MLFDFSSAGWTQAFEADPLTLNNKAFVRALGHRQQYFRQAVRVTAACAGKMGMALALGAIIS